METLTDTYTLRAVVTETEDGRTVVTVSAMVNDGRSSGPYMWEETRDDVDPTRAMVLFLAELTGGKRLHPDW